MVEQHSFIIPIKSLQEKVEKHTSVLGKHRSADGSQYLMEQFAMTQGEHFLFDDYLPEAVAKTYNWIRAFARNVEDGYRVFKGGALRQVREDNAVRVVVDGVQRELPTIVMPIAKSKYSVTVVATTEEAIVYDVRVTLPQIQIFTGNAEHINYDMKVKYLTLADGIFEDVCSYNTNGVVLEDGATLDGVLAFRLRIDQSGFATVIERIEQVELTLSNYSASAATTYRKGEFIEYVGIDGTVRYGIQKRTYKDVDVERWFDEDIRESVVFNVEIPDWVDRNMLPAAEEHLGDALMHYIIYRWFETVNPKEAETYKDKWEEKAHEAQLALNSERRILQRKSTWL